MVTVNQSDFSGPNISHVIDYELTEDGYYSEEPVSVALAKQYCRALTGTAEDDLFALFIVSARNAIEKFTGLSLVGKVCQAIILAPQEGFEMPFGPVTSPVTFVDQDANSSSLEVIGFDFPKTKFPYNIITTGTYTCGYTNSNLPSQLKTAILFQINFLYENRGDNSDTGVLCKAARIICQSYTRQPFFS